MTTIRRRPEMYGRHITTKRKRYQQEQRCIDCGSASNTLRCDICNSRQNSYMIEWRKRHRTRLLEEQKKWRKENPDLIKRHNKKRNARQYSLTLEEYEELIKQPCGICGATTRRRAMDHCHKSNKVRGVLCIPCNSKLGWYEKHKDIISEWVTFGGRK
jgi:recombinational DNA repair protein RecR